MHEYSIVESLVDELVAQIEREGNPRVVTVVLRRSSAFSEDALRGAWEALALHTAFEGTELKVETVNCDFACECGHSQVIKGDDLVEHVFVCPKCNSMTEIAEAHDLELLEVVVEEPVFEFADKIIPGHPHGGHGHDHGHAH